MFSRHAVCISFARAATCTSQRGWTRLELWYDDLHFQKWKDKNNKAPPRKGEYKVFNRIARAHKLKLHQKSELPAAVRDILQSPKCELKIDVLEELRKAIVACTFGVSYIQVDCEEAEELARAIERCTGRFGEVGKGSELLPVGARVVVDARIILETMQHLLEALLAWLKDSRLLTSFKEMEHRMDMVS